MVVFLFYIIWRYYILGSIFGNLSTGGTTEASPNLILSFFYSIMQFNKFMFGEAWPIAAVIFSYSTIYSIIKVESFWKIATGAIVTSFVPIIPLANNPGIYFAPRYTIIIWLFFSLVILFYFSTSTSHLYQQEKNTPPFDSGKDNIKILKFIPYIIIIAFVTISIYSYTKFRHHYDNIYQEFEVQGKFIENQNSSKFYIPSPILMGNFWYLNSLCNIKKMRGLGDCPVPIIKDTPIEIAPAQIFTYDIKTGSMTDVSFLKNQILENAKEIDTSAALTATLKYRDGQVFWKFGPYAEGQYFIVSPELGRLSLPASGSIPTETRSYALYVQHLAPNGTLTSSPLLQLPAGGQVQWERP